MTYAQAVKEAEAFLADHGIADASVDAWLLFSFVTGVSRAMFLAERMQKMPEEQHQRYRELLEKRASHIPLQHLTGEQEFMGFSFLVNQHVLVPRQDTETLVETVLSYVKPGMRVLDLCTGSGCIAISMAKLCDGLQVDAADISKEALAVAMENAARLEANVTFWQGDLFACHYLRGDTEKLPIAAYDCIVSNPPYIRTDVIKTLSEEVRLHEPYQALDGKADGLYFYRRIITEAHSYLTPGGHIFFEIGYDQGEAVKNLLLEDGYTEVEVRKDLAGLDRVVTGEYPGKNP
ncbi:MAG: peptide chain release factor N(5)-glutamine methyltransferase [Lachnospiraceae bacterium]|nr:peptide chain release factor N(5)-glutamine methyltransferase [Lachnospiraceae bacterium]